MKNNKIDKKIIFLLLVVIVLLIDTLIVYKYFYQITYYDSSPELVLGELLAKENKLITSSWYYSTELRVFYTQIINSFLFRFISNYRIVNALSLFFHLSVLEFSLYLFFNQIFKKRGDLFFWFSALWIVIPYSWVWRTYVFDGMYYIPHFIIILLSISMFYLCINLPKNSTNIYVKLAILYILQAFLAILAGLGGVRHLEITYMPMFLACFILAWYDRNIIMFKNKTLLISLIMLALCGIGYIINNKILAHIMHFRNYGNIKLVAFSWSRLERIFTCINENFSFVAGEKLFSFAGIASISSFIIWVVIIIVVPTIIKRFKVFSEEEKFFLIFTAIQWIMNIFILLFTDTACESRYFLPQILTLLCSLIIFMRKCLIDKIEFFKVETKRALCILLSIFIAIETVKGYHDWMKEDKTPNLRQVVSYLVENNYEIGYSEFYTGNAIPSLSNGKIDICCVDDFHTLSANTWLMKVEIAKKKKGSEKAFILFTPAQYESFKELNYIEGGTKIDINESYVLIVYPDLTTLWSKVNCQ